ncbi:MAG: hypothetical protein ACJA0U_001756 [Salibacteraceae bacterium]|jgi:hypothetical protein
MASIYTVIIGYMYGAFRAQIAIMTYDQRDSNLDPIFEVLMKIFSE